jgi:hypothetical protein
VGEDVADRRRGRLLVQPGHVAADGVVEADPTLLAQPHDAGRGEALGL